MAMTTTKIAIVLLFAAPLASAQVPAPIEPPTALDSSVPPSKKAVPDQRVVHEYAGDEIADVLQDLAKKAGIPVFIRSTVQGTATLRLENRTAREVLDVIVQANNLVIGENDGVYYIDTVDGLYKRATERATFPAKLMLDAYRDKGFTRAEAMKLILNAPRGAHFDLSTPLPDSSKPGTKSSKRATR